MSSLAGETSVCWRVDSSGRRCSAAREPRRQVRIVSLAPPTRTKRGSLPAKKLKINSKRMHAAIQQPCLHVRVCSGPAAVGKRVIIEELSGLLRSRSWCVHVPGACRSGALAFGRGWWNEPCASLVAAWVGFLWAELRFRESFLRFKRFLLFGMLVKLDRTAATVKMPIFEMESGVTRWAKF